MNDAASASPAEYEPLPDLYDRWLQALLGDRIPRETRASCSDCAMCAKPGETPDSRAVFFDPVIKCCTYVPDLPNYLVGGILNDVDPAAAGGRNAMLQRLAERVAVTPLSVGRAPVYARLYDEIVGAFGRSPTMACPYFLADGGRCGVWRHRNSICSTWFCKHVRGKTAYGFWRGSLQPMLEEVEADLKVWCALELGLGKSTLRDLAESHAWSGRYDPLSSEDFGNRVDPAAYAKLWGEWIGREAEYFMCAADLVQALSWTDVLSIVGPRARAHAELTREAFVLLTSTDLPPRLQASSFSVVRAGPETTRVSSYAPYDPIDVPNIVLALLHLFDGRPTEAAMAEIEAKTGVRLEPALVLKLADFGLLEPPAANAV